MGDKGSILVIDDSSTIRRLANLVLQEEGFTVYTAEDGEEGLKLAEETSPSLILVDFVMPRMNGYQFCILAKENPALKNIPIILITSKGEEVGEEFTDRFGVADYLIKPFEPEDLIAKATEILLAHPNKPQTGEDEAAVEPPAQAADDRGPLQHIEQALDDVLHRYLVRELPSLLQRSIVDAFKHEGVIKSTSIALSGDFSVFGLLDVFNILESAQPTGKLSIYSHNLSAEFYIDSGNIVYASSSRHGGNILDPELLKSRKNLPPEALDQAYQEWRDQGVPVFATLESKGWLKKEDILSLVREQIEKIIDSILEMNDGRFFFEKMILPPAFSTSGIAFPPSGLVSEAGRGTIKTKGAQNV